MMRKINISNLLILVALALGAAGLISAVVLLESPMALVVLWLAVSVIAVWVFWGSKFFYFAVLMLSTGLANIALLMLGVAWWLPYFLVLVAFVVLAGVIGLAARVME